MAMSSFVSCLQDDSQFSFSEYNQDNKELRVFFDEMYYVFKLKIQTAISECHVVKLVAHFNAEFVLDGEYRQVEYPIYYKHPVIWFDHTSDIEQFYYYSFLPSIYGFMTVNLPQGCYATCSVLVFNIDDIDNIDLD